MILEQCIKFIKYRSLLITVAFIASCGVVDEPDENEIEPLSVGESITLVNAAFAEIKNFEHVIQANGKVKSLHEQSYTCESSGELLVCKAYTGKSITSGSLILQLETTPIEFRLQKAKQTQFNSKKEYESQLLGYENLLKDKTKEQADNIRQKLKISTGLEGAEQDIKEAKYALTKAVIRAPFNGVLANVNVRPGQRVKVGDELFRIYDPYNMLLEIKVLEADIMLLKKGIPAEISPISHSEKKYKAVVYEINPYVDENGMVLVKLQILNLDTHKRVTEIFPGMNCTALIKVPFPKTLLVPKDAVVMRNGKAVVFTLEEGKAKWNYVTTGRDNGREMEVKEGLKHGQKVIVDNNLQLAHDAPVKEKILSPTD